MKQYVEQIGDNKFKMTHNDLLNCRLTLGTEFETRINKEDKYEIIRITKESEYITRRFFLSSRFKEADYLMLGKELTDKGGFWENFSSIAIINIPKDFPYDIDEVMKDLNIELAEITDD